mmetsp:Transcript_12567/g.17176  ORF Transcript_12567/g.17176 Transcript_12567/m.17176 type:complete len:113 (-) Transcript_12567:41-379(-)
MRTSRAHLLLQRSSSTLIETKEGRKEGVLCPSHSFGVGYCGQSVSLSGWILIYLWLIWPSFNAMTSQWLPSDHPPTYPPIHAPDGIVPSQAGRSGNLLYEEDLMEGRKELWT